MLASKFFGGDKEAVEKFLTPDYRELFSKFSNLREIKRFVNQTYNSILPLWKEVNTDDFIILNSIKYLFKDLYDWIKMNKSNLVYSYQKHIERLIRGTGISELKKNFDVEFEDSKHPDKNLYKRLMALRCFIWVICNPVFLLSGISL